MSLSQKRIQWMGMSFSLLALTLLLGLSACGLPGSSSGSNTKSGSNGGSTASPAVQATPTIDQGTPTAGATTTVSTPVASKGNGGGNNTGPIVVASPSPAPGGNTHSAQVILPDRTLIINDAVKQAGTSASTVEIALKLTIKNTSQGSIKNQATYYQLIGSEGDAFGQQSSATAAFFGAIPVGSSRSGMIVFEVPAAATNGLRLLYRPEVTTDTVFVNLKI